MNENDQTQNENPLAAPLDFGDFAGVGMENVGSEDVAIPFLGIIQSGSPQVDPDHAKYSEKCIEGAKAGQFYNTVTNELFANPDEVYFVPCCKEHKYVEWVPYDQGGGFVGVHEPYDPLIIEAKKVAKKFNEVFTPDGAHELDETFYVYGFLVAGPETAEVVTPIMVAFNSTKIKVYKKQLMTRLRTIKGDPPMFGFRFKVTTVKEPNKAGKMYYNFKIDPACGSMNASANTPGSKYEKLLVVGKKLVEEMQAGQLKVEYSQQGEQGPKNDGDIPF